jgi:hypothetical protein
MHFLERVQKYKSPHLNIQYHLLYTPNNLLPPKEETNELISRLKGTSPVVPFEYESDTLQLYKDYQQLRSQTDKEVRGRNSSSYARFTFPMLSEPFKEFFNSGINDTDFVFRYRMDYYLPDSLIQMITQPQFYHKLQCPNRRHKILDSKIWIPYIGKKMFCDFCAYFNIAKVTDFKKCLILDPEEVQVLWEDNFLTRDHPMFIEKLFFIKPFLKALKDNHISQTSGAYWEIINDNFVAGGYGGGMRTLFFAFRPNAFGPDPRIIAKVSPDISEAETSQYKKNIETYGSLPAGCDLKWLTLSPQEWLY